MSRLSVLLLADDWPGHANTVNDHIRAFTEMSRHSVRQFNPRWMRRSWALDLDEFDAVVIHYSLVVSSDRYLTAPFREKLRRYRGLKVQFIQDEYRWVDTVTAAMAEIGVGLIYTAAPEPAASLIYNGNLRGVPRVITLTGYVPENLVGLTTPPLRDRPLDLAYRGRDLPYWLGRLSHEKVAIAKGWVERIGPYGLKSDVAWRESDRIYGQAWIDFISSARATLATESGASIADFDGSVERGVRNFLLERPDASFEEVHAAVLEAHEGNMVVNVVSPRIFEAAALRTTLVMFPGSYSGTVTPWEHYIPLERDFSNLDDVVKRLRDVGFLEEMTERSYQELVASGRYSYRRFIDEFDDDLEARVAPRRRTAAAPRYRLALAERTLRVPPLYLRIYRGALRSVAWLSRSEVPLRFGDDPGAYIGKGALAVRAAAADSTLRGLFREGRRARLPTDRLLEELLEISILRDLASSHTGGPAVGAELDRAGRRLLFRSEPDGGPTSWVAEADVAELLATGGLNAIEWDHRRVGATITRGRLEIAIGAEGCQSFELLAQLSRSSPEAVGPVLQPLLGPRSQAEAFV